LLIAQRFDVPVQLLAQVNDISDVNLIQVGQTLHIPSKAQVREHERDQAVQQPTEATREASLLPEMLQLDRALLTMYGFQGPSRLLGQSAPLWLRTASLPLPLLAINAPDSIVQGRTGIVWITSLLPIPPTGVFQGRELIFIGDGRSEQGYRFFALMPTGALDRPGSKKLKLRLGQVAWERPITILPGQYETQHIVLPASKGGLLAPDKLKAERERLYALWSKISGPPQWTEAFRFPIGEGFARTSPYGSRRSYNGGPVSSFHAGTDWGAPEGTPILAPAPGVIVLAEPLFVRGGAVIIDHGAGVYSNFWHMSRIDVEPGDEVDTGDQLGLVGTTGLSTGAHLHWEIRINTVAVDPMQWTETPLP
jgi:murein DD-endopeptidase MepM/ murein hydrolase activator NlpD